MVGSAKSEQQKLPQQYFSTILGTTETALNNSTATAAAAAAAAAAAQQQPLQPLHSQSTLQQPKELATAKW